MKKDIYIVLHTLSLGGAERHASSIANFLSENGYKVNILLLDNNRIDYDLSRKIDVVALSNKEFEKSNCSYKPNIKESVCLKVYKRLLFDKYLLLDKFLYLQSTYINKLRCYFKQQNNINESIVISFMTFPNICTSVLKKEFNYTLILNEFTAPQLEFEPNAPENKLKKKNYINADGFIFQTEQQKSFYSFLPYVKKTVIPNPIEEIKTQPYSGIRRKEIVNYCKHVKAKNLPLLVESFAILSNDYPEYKLVIYGDGPTKSETEECIKKYNVEDKVILKPYAKNVLELVRDCTMFVTSSDREGISNSMLEAMAIGLPTISTDCPAGGARMFIKSYENGIIVPVRDSKAMYQAMKYMIEHPDEAEKMGQNAVQIRSTLEKNKVLKRWLLFVDKIGES